MAQASRVSFDEVDFSMIIGNNPETRQVPGIANQSYQTIPLSYNFGGKGSPKIGDFKLEGCEMSSAGGIQEKLGQDGKKKEYSLMTKLPVTKKECEIYVKVMEGIHLAAAKVLSSVKGAVKMPTYDVTNPQNGFKSPIYWPRDKVSGDLIKGRDPSQWLKLFKMGTGFSEVKTLFSDLNNKPIAWSLLSNVDMKFIPVFHIKSIYVGGGKASLQISLESAVVTYLAARNSVGNQTDTIEKYVKSNPKSLETLAEQIAKLNLERKSESKSEPYKTSPQQEKSPDVAVTIAEPQKPKSLTDFMSQPPTAKVVNLS